MARRVSEFGTLKALGWRSRRIVAQVLAESAVIGVAGAVIVLAVVLAVTGALLAGSLGS